MTKRKRSVVKRGDPVLVIMGEYGLVYQGRCTSNMSQEDEYEEGVEAILFTEPEGWCFYYRDLHYMRIEDLDTSIMEALNKTTRAKIDKLTYCWVLKSEIILPKRRVK